MKRFQFRQQTLLAFKEQYKRTVELKVAQAQQAVLDARRCLEQAVEQLNALSNEIGSAVGDVLDASFLWRDSVDHVHEQRHLAEARLQAAEQELIAVQHQLGKITADVEALQQLRASRWRAHLKDRQNEQQRDLEFDVMRRWIGNQTVPGKDESRD